MVKFTFCGQKYFLFTYLLYGKIVGCIGENYIFRVLYLEEQLGDS